ncbi:MAG: WecB/TagA/CpsF family glycosyltransferase [Bdellovibrionota bacterium]
MQNAHKVKILGSAISTYGLDETVEKLRELSQDGQKHYICVSNVHTVVMGLDDPQYAHVTNQATLATADGVPLIWASQLLGGPKIHGRASGPDILKAILVDPKAKHLRHYFYGSTPEVLKRLEVRLRELAPDAQLAGFYSPPMRPSKAIDAPATSDELEDCQKIDEAKPHLVWVGLGAPKQETWMYRLRPHLKAPVLLGVGAAFDFLAGTKKRAPVWMQKSGLEWLHRLSQEPTRLASRYFKTNPIFVAAVAKQCLLSKTKER